MKMSDFFFENFGDVEYPLKSNFKCSFSFENINFFDNHLLYYSYFRAMDTKSMHKISGNFSKDWEISEIGMSWIKKENWHEIRLYCMNIEISMNLASLPIRKQFSVASFVDFSTLLKETKASFVSFLKTIVMAKNYVA